VAPDCSTTASALSFFDALIAVPGAAPYLTDFTYHRYGVGAGDIAAIAQRAASRQLRTGMLEHIGSGYEDLYTDLTVGNVSSWEQYTVAYPCTASCGGDNGAQYFVIDRSVPTNPRVVMGSRTRFLAQYFRHVRMGAVRIGATSDTAAFAPVAFANPDGTQVAVVKATGAGTFAIRGLSPATYGIAYTTAASSDVHLPDAVVGPDGAVNTGIPAAGVLTVYWKAVNCAVTGDGAACDDGNPCTRGDVCQGGVCTGSEVRQSGCRSPQPGHGLVVLKNKSPDRRDSLLWKWDRGAATSEQEFGDPIAGSTSYALCIYDSSGGSDRLLLHAALPAGGTCGEAACWKRRSTALKYRDPARTAGGVEMLLLKPGEDGRAKIVLKGKGEPLGLPAVLDVQQDPRVTVQLQSSEGDCWDAVYSVPALRNLTDSFKDAGD
jgi:hypothetical protein